MHVQLVQADTPALGLARLDAVVLARVKIALAQRAPAAAIAELRAALPGTTWEFFSERTASTIAKLADMTIDLGNNEEMRVAFKDYGFFVPKDCDGKEATFKGTATFDTTSVADLQHYASDEGLAQEEIDKITEPEIALVFEAMGVVIKCPKCP